MTGAVADSAEHTASGSIFSACQVWLRHQALRVELQEAGGVEVEELQLETFSPFSRNKEHAAPWDPAGWRGTSLWWVALVV